MSFDDWNDGWLEGQRDMLAKAIAAVEAVHSHEQLEPRTGSQRQGRAGKAMTDPEILTQGLDRHSRAGVAHDPLCPSTDPTESEYCALCHCDLIAKVREDTLAKCIASIRPLNVPNSVAVLRSLQVKEK